jgi:hypothetical protein
MAKKNGRKSYKRTSPKKPKKRETRPAGYLKELRAERKTVETRVKRRAAKTTAARAAKRPKMVKIKAWPKPTKPRKKVAATKPPERSTTTKPSAEAYTSHAAIAHNREVNPDYYVGHSGQQVIDVLEDFDLTENMYRGQAMQYMFRAGRKDRRNTVVDLLKARWYIDREIARISLQAKSARHDVRMAS